MSYVGVGHASHASHVLFMPRTSGSLYCKHSSRPENKERDREFKEFGNTTENVTRTCRVQKTRPKTITRGPKSYLSAHRDPKKKKEFDDAPKNLTRPAFRPE